MQIDLSVVISIIALITSLISIYLQWFRVRGPIIALLNTEGEQRAVLLPYGRLPQAIQQHFPEYKEKFQGYALVRLVFANSGDRAGFTEIKKIEVQNPPAPSWAEADRIRASFHSYALIPAYEINSHEILLRNIPPIDKEMVIDVAVEIDWGGPNPRTGEYKRKGTIKQRLKVLLIPTVRSATKS